SAAGRDGVKPGCGACEPDAESDI
ncbi:hypothetical protein AZ032_004994, partial [Klebsiella pneumoniae]